MYTGSLDILLSPSWMNRAKSDEVGKQPHRSRSRSFLHFPTCLNSTPAFIKEYLSALPQYQAIRRAQKLSVVGMLLGPSSINKAGLA